MAVGFYDLDFQYTLIFNDAFGVDLVIANCGAIEITDVSATTVTCKIDAEVDEQSFLNGNFSVPICP